MTTIAMQRKFDARQISTIRMILDENRKVITVISEKENMSYFEAEQLFSDTIRYLYLCLISEKALSPNERIDLGWHHFILCTKEYANFCNRHIGYFIHHNPFTQADKNQISANPVKETFLFAKSVYTDLSGNWYIHNGENENCNDSGKCCDGGDCSNTGNCSHCGEE